MFVRLALHVGAGRPASTSKAGDGDGGGLIYPTNSKNQLLERYKSLMTVCLAPFFGLLKQTHLRFFSVPPATSRESVSLGSTACLSVSLDYKTNTDKTVSPPAADPSDFTQDLFL